MPTYTYKCKDCGNINEVIQKISDEPLTKCDCGGSLNKVIHPAGIIFKGSGFYKTDYGTSGGAATAGKPEASCPAASGSCSTACPSKN